MKQAATFLLISLVGLIFLEPRPGRADEPSVPDAIHVIVRKPEPGRALGWPANGGIWNWGNEILVQYLDCPYKNVPGFSNHDSDPTHPSATWMTARSLDGGVTWEDHRVAFPDPRANRAMLKPQTIFQQIDFGNPDTIVNFHWDGLGRGA